MNKFAAVFLAGFALCVAGQVVFVVGEVLQVKALAQAGAWLTVPLTILYAAMLALIVAAFPVVWAVSAASWLRCAWRRCRLR